ncbi:ricin-type beta-trefoil lectin domain protein [Streptomyces sp. NBC_01622]|uniref:ricin-type beta-trefoil lectin domain protein n=1 Tax=Streptomyces sp. NBC_01622 TaxID=2975903 RepID=UPI00386E922A|nr:ricin-type beta-trefoil lectin domain protein [Streptomyces sp. NBC_01622]
MSGKNSPQHQAATGGTEPAPAPDTTTGGAPETATALPPTSGETTAGASVTAARVEAALTAPAQLPSTGGGVTPEAAVGTDEAALPAADPDTHADPTSTSASASDPDPDPEAATATATATGASSESGTGSGTGEDTAAAAPAFGRPSRGLLAGAAIAGALLIGVPFLVSGMLGKSSSDGKPSEQVADAGTVLNSATANIGAGAYGSASPDPASPKPTASNTVGGGKNNTVKKGAGAVAAGAGSGAGVIAGSSAEAPKNASSGGSSKKSTTKVTASKTVTTAPGTTIYSHASNKCIEMVGHKGADGSPLEIWSCSSGNWQKWDFRSDGTVRSMGLCMDVAWGSSANGAVIQLAVCSGNPAQQFRLNSSNDLVNPQANKCVDVKDQKTGNGTRLQLWDCNGQDNQKWSTR